MEKTNSFKMLIRKGFFFVYFFCICIVAVHATILLPNIPATQFVITDYGATTSSIDNAAAINSAISAANSGGGGMVVIPSGTFLSGPITMKSNVNLYLSAGAILQILPYGNGNGIPAGSYPNNGTADTYNNFIFGQSLSNIEISGLGTIEGNGSAWWTAYNANSAISRPCLIRFKACNTVLITGITIKNAPNVHITLGQSGSSYGSNGTISNVTVSAPSTAPNTDAIDTWYWNGIDIHNCNLSVGDDNVAMNTWSTNINIKNCTFGTGHGVSVGSYTNNVENVSVDSCSFTGTTNGIRLKSAVGRGGNDSNFVYSNITMNNVQYPIYITSWYPKEPYPASAQVAGTVTATTPQWKNIYFKNMIVTNSTYGGIIYGLREMYVNNVTFDNVQMTATKSGLITNFVNGLVFKNCSSITLPAGKGNAIIPYEATISGINTTSGVSTDCNPSRIANISSTSELSCFPNPLKGDNLTVNAGFNISKVKIYTLTGVEVKEGIGNHSMQLPLNLTGISPGYYIVNVVFEDGNVSSLKLIKQ